MNDNEIRRLREDMEAFEDEIPVAVDPQAQSQHWVGVTVANTAVDGKAFPTVADSFYWVKAVPVLGQEVAGQPGSFGNKDSTIEGITNVRLCYNIGPGVPIAGTPTDSKGGSLVVVCDLAFRSIFNCTGAEPVYAGDPPP